MELKWNFRTHVLKKRITRLNASIKPVLCNSPIIFERRSVYDPRLPHVQVSGLPDFRQVPQNKQLSSLVTFIVRLFVEEITKLETQGVNGLCNAIELLEVISEMFVEEEERYFSTFPSEEEEKKCQNAEEKKEDKNNQKKFPVQEKQRLLEIAEVLDQSLERTQRTEDYSEESLLKMYQLIKDEEIFTPVRKGLQFLYGKVKKEHSDLSFTFITIEKNLKDILINLSHIACQELIEFHRPNPDPHFDPEKIKKIRDLFQNKIENNSYDKDNTPNAHRRKQVENKKIAKYLQKSRELRKILKKVVDEIIETDKKEAESSVADLSCSFEESLDVSDSLMVKRTIERKDKDGKVIHTFTGYVYREGKEPERSEFSKALDLVLPFYSIFKYLDINN
jgi:hypothetical protein